MPPLSALFPGSSSEPQTNSTSRPWSLPLDSGPHFSRRGNDRLWTYATVLLGEVGR